MKVAESLQIFKKVIKAQMFAQFIVEGVYNNDCMRICKKYYKNVI